MTDRHADIQAMSDEDRKDVFEFAKRRSEEMETEKTLEPSTDDEKRESVHKLLIDNSRIRDQIKMIYQILSEYSELDFFSRKFIDIQAANDRINLLYDYLNVNGLELLALQLMKVGTREVK